ncbi:MAG: aminotransferase class V-fold PLP-dependent enzyme, partial [Rubripirellula sp.]
HRLRRELESDPIRFLAPERELEPKLDAVRSCLSRLVNAPASDIAFVRNATDGVNAVVRSMKLRAGDEIVCTDHGYNACNNAARFAIQRAEGNLRVAKIPFPLRSENEVIEAIESELTGRTKLLLVDHVTSPTGLVFPLPAIIAAAHSRDIPVLVDGAHAPGMIPLDLTELDADYYTANHHKWLCGPKVSGFLYVRPEHQANVRPTVISHAANRDRPDRSRFIAEFDWNGTFDPTPLLSVPAAIDFLNSLMPGGIHALMKANQTKAIIARSMLCEALHFDCPAPDSMIGSLASIPLPDSAQRRFPSIDDLCSKLFDDYHLELPIFEMPAINQQLLRVSLQAYNDIEQIERLCNALRIEFDG